MDRVPPDDDGLDEFEAEIERNPEDSAEPAAITKELFCHAFRSYRVAAPNDVRERARKLLDLRAGGLPTDLPLKVEEAIEGLHDFLAPGAHRPGLAHAIGEIERSLQAYCS